MVYSLKNACNKTPNACNKTPIACNKTPIADKIKVVNLESVNPLKQKSIKSFFRTTTSHEKHVVDKRKINVSITNKKPFVGTPKKCRKWSITKPINETGSKPKRNLSHLDSLDKSASCPLRESRNPLQDITSSSSPNFENIGVLQPTSIHKPGAEIMRNDANLHPPSVYSPSTRHNEEYTRHKDLTPGSPFDQHNNSDMISDSQSSRSTIDLSDDGHDELERMRIFSIFDDNSVCEATSPHSQSSEHENEAFIAMPDSAQWLPDYIKIGVLHITYFIN